MWRWNSPAGTLPVFRPGDNLADYVHYFTLHIEGDQQIRAFGQSEALAQSACKRKSRDALWCGSCHDAHSSPSPEERVTYYRQKCLACHGQALGAKHHASQPDCTSCHMPRANSADVAHTQATDHRILKVPSMTLLPLPSVAFAPHLSRFPAVRPDEAPEPKATETRDVALARAESRSHP